MEDVIVETFSSFFEKVEAKDEEGVYGMFAPNIAFEIPDFMDDVRNLIRNYSGEFVFYSLSCGVGDESEFDEGLVIRFIPTVADDLVTTLSHYYVSAYICDIDDKDQDNIGIWNLRIQKIDTEGEEMIHYSSYKSWAYGSNYRGILLL